MQEIIDEGTIRSSLKEVNKWHQKTPLLFAFSKQRPGIGGDVSGNVSAVKAAYDDLFGLQLIGLDDEANKFYLQICHGEETATPYALRKPTTEYGKGHQRSIKDTFANNNFLERTGEGKYKLSPYFVEKVFSYLGITQKIDIKPLLILRYWNNIGTNNSVRVRDLYQEFDAIYCVSQPPFNDIFICSELDEIVHLQSLDANNFDIKKLFLPHEYGTDVINIEFWRNFKNYLNEELDRLKWQGERAILVASITSALMQDQALFLLGPSGTGKSTLVREAILPALRKANGTANELRYSEYK
jgi:hypothetical protein